jgi:hypothetical protein
LEIRRLVQCFQPPTKSDIEAAFSFSSAKQMDVIRHDYVSSDIPAVSLPGRLPFRDQDTGNLL